MCVVGSGRGQGRAEIGGRDRRRPPDFGIYQSARVGFNVKLQALMDERRGGLSKREFGGWLLTAVPSTSVFTELPPG